MTLDPEKSAIEKFLEDQKSHIILKLFRLLSTTIRAAILLSGTCFRVRSSDEAADKPGVLASCSEPALGGGLLL